MTSQEQQLLQDLCARLTLTQGQPKDAQADAELRRWLLAPRSTPPGAAIEQQPQKTLCNCLNVSEQSICAGIARGLDLDGLKNELKCGTSCGSCVPEIKRLLATQALPVSA
mgnify:CR=1 FL=1